MVSGARHFLRYRIRPPSYTRPRYGLPPWIEWPWMTAAADSASRVPDTHDASRQRGRSMPKLLQGSPLALEWNGNKLWGVTEERRIDYREADGISDAPVPDTLPRHRAETRWAAVGIVDGKEIAVAYTVRDNRRRIITARRARTHERGEHHTNVTDGGKPPQRPDGLGVACEARCRRCGA